jgi:FAD synthase
VGVDVEHWLRGQERYDDIDALMVQIRADVDRTRALLGS